MVEMTACQQECGSHAAEGAEKVPNDVLGVEAPAQRRELGDHEIRGRILTGFKWSMATAGVMQVTQIVTSLVLVRLLSPRDYGLAGMTLLFQGIVVVVADVSMGAALIQRREITEADRSTMFWCTAAIGILLTVSGLLLSGPLADFYNQPAVRPLFAVLSLSFVLTALQMTPQALLDREMQFKLVNLRIGGAAIVGSTVALTAAFLGAGAWALVLGQVATSASGLLLIWACCSWRPRLLFSRTSFRNLAGFGTRLCGSNMLTFVTNNADTLMVARFLGFGRPGRVFRGLQPDVLTAGSRHRPTAVGAVSRILALAERSQADSGGLAAHIAGDWRCFHPGHARIHRRRARLCRCHLGR